MKADAETEAKVLATLDRFAEGYASRDLDAILAVFAPGAVLIGTGADEKRIGLGEIRAQIERDLAQSEALNIQYQWATVMARGSVAWVASEAIVRWKTAGAEGSTLLRHTVVLERRGGHWLWVQSHASIPPAEQAEGESFPTPIEAVASAVSADRPDLRAHAAPDGTVTMLFTDIEGSTVMTERLGDQRWLDVLRAHNAIIRQHVQANGCFEVKNQGDGFMVASQSARRAIQCAIGIQRAIAAYNERARDPMNVRMGLHTGEVVKDADDFFGKHVILASRVANEAKGGQILVSSLLKELTESGGDIPFGERHDVELKGLSGTYHVYEVRWREESA